MNKDDFIELDAEEVWDCYQKAINKEFRPKLKEAHEQLNELEMEFNRMKCCRDGWEYKAKRVERQNEELKARLVKLQKNWIQGDK